MNQKEIKELIELLVEKDIAEFEMERGDVKLHIKRGDRCARCGAGGCAGGAGSLLPTVCRRHGCERRLRSRAAAAPPAAAVMRTPTCTS